MFSDTMILLLSLHSSPYTLLKIDWHAFVGGGICVCMREGELAIPLQGSLPAAADGHAESQKGWRIECHCRPEQEWLIWLLCQEGHQGW